MEGVGNAGYPMYPRPVCKGRKHTVVTTVAPEHPAFPHAMVLTVYSALSSATNSFCHRHRRMSGLREARLGSQDLRRFDTSNGCQDHTASPYATRLRQEASPACAHPRSVGEDRSSAVRLRAPIAHGEPPCDQNARPTLPRPPHPIPTFVTMANAPREGWDGGVMGVIWGRREGEYFCGEDWTGGIGLIWLKKLVVTLHLPIRRER